jgi:hypothetical protein
MNFSIFGAFWHRTLGDVGHSVMEYVITHYPLFYSLTGFIESANFYKLCFSIFNTVNTTRSITFILNILY